MLTRPPEPCPTCGEPAFVVEWKREPRETTWDDSESMPSWRTFVPGPAADVTLDCGHTITGEAGLAWLREYTAVPPTVVLGGVDLSPYVGAFGRIESDQAPVDLMDGYLAGLRTARLSVGVDAAFSDVGTFLPGLEDGTPMTWTMPVPANRWHRMLARLRGVPGFGWVRPRMVEQTVTGTVTDVRTAGGQVAFTLRPDDGGRRG